MDKIIEKMFSVGAHFGYSKTKRHPSVKKFIFGAKNKVEIFDLEKTVKSLEDAKTFAKDLAASGKQILFVSSKMEAKETIENGASSVAAPFVAGRWIGGTLTNSTEIRKRVTKFLKLESDKEKGLLAKYTKKERLLIDREIDKLSRKFSGLTSMEGMPGALFVVDPKKEEIAVKEAIEIGIPVIAVANSDCNIKNIKYPIAANDSAMASIKFFTDEIVKAYGEGKKSAPKKEVVKREFSRR
ncbi:30S ribosomal protein S2 [Candidatus Campbellbacteria bacterium RIFCSPLOWO2_02_FULL_35_11]|uniref:Small ribosomal subunit protein uS2 n=2 Tax=Candidatus Campbelliibacteriota TaxID=1752727 RepID=A0A1F5EL75_9BACT|nr:MAG: 30S ribosomal protein S2 [Candidatus Campbellbacteria bacterium RIFCSPHIGHO2_12_FULL_35_10]OGD70513.1 MAG: 30S ribosomal protein S2 [Candidatus Campbellbacteria bacterium RIFCSPLOWO2_02_FULL_35_11]